MDLLGLFIKAWGGKEYFIVTVGYFTRWIEAKALSSITSKQVNDFFREDAICIFGILKVLITDKGKQFDVTSFKEFCEQLGIDQRFVSVVHLQTDGLVEVSNRTILQGVKKRLNNTKANWIEELSSVLWCLRTTPQNAIGESPFSLCFSLEALFQQRLAPPVHGTTTSTLNKMNKSYEKTCFL